MLSPSTEQQQLRAQLELLQSHEAEHSPGSPSSGTHDSRDASTRSANGYEDLHFAASVQDTAARALATKSDADSHIHPDLRAVHDQHSPTSAMMQLAQQDHHGHSPVSTGGHPQGPAAPPLAPAGGDPMALDSADGRKSNKRELSQSKRAAQNRAAQRAFRQRKEGYIKKLEQQVRDYTDIEMTLKQYQSENFALRDYIIQLQSRMLETLGEFPPPPSNVNLSHSQSAAATTSAAAAPAAATTTEAQPENAAAGTPLEAVAQAVAGLAAQEQLSSEQRAQQYAAAAGTYKADGHHEDTRTADEINRHLNAEEGTTA
ncbi:bZIP transcription factor [Cordyceps fumosorosea ARSEF 2679]|uniref:Putative transcription factor kapC n=1 Tax=Cordyceps fumosorosea (strain ARSEF 2679) TaxID=1081104 RepID=A0A167UA18_CORFA|nr:bZIP transcription factor [Cordyceps fumosorosea ARSEF 2679]OAA61372.1 bZIP transcription factor [Cordyceps fumosorosea ARSEF 2679]